MIEKMNEYIRVVNDAVIEMLPSADEGQNDVVRAMRYSLANGGKRLRPIFTLEFCKMCGGDVEKALPLACAVEYIHTYSLIHDDLPCMDDDDMRRGNPSCHKMYGEATALLAGDALLSTAAETVTGSPLAHAGDPDEMTAHVRAAHEIMSRAGACGMIAGQTADIRGENLEPDAGLIRYIELHKTADLITAPVRAGLMLARADEEMLDAFTTYAQDIGVAFQILDDILDIEGDQALLGKTLGKDAEQGKCNYAYVHGLDAAKDELHRLTAEAKDALAAYGDKASFFTELADTLEIRNH